MTDDAPKFDPSPRIAEELKLPLAGVRAVLALLAEGASVPFIARYRKEQTGGLDEVQIRAVEEKGAYYTELDERRRAIVRHEVHEHQVALLLFAGGDGRREHPKGREPQPQNERAGPHLMKETQDACEGGG